MKAHDFEFDSIRLSDKNFMLCRFNGGGIDTINMPEITFNTVSTSHGLVNHLTSTEYEDCLTFTLQICKNLCDCSDMEISVEDLRDITRWLNRKSYQKLRLLDDELSGIYFMASFNISRIEMDGKLVGLELEAITDSPFAHHNPITVKFDIEPDTVKDIYNKSDEEGHIYPDSMAITVKEAGDLEIRNAFDDRITVVKNCELGESIVLNYPMITSSSLSHNVLNDFNWRFFRLVSSFKDRLNSISSNLPCSIELTYTPIVKIGV